MLKVSSKIVSGKYIKFTFTNSEIRLKFPDLLEQFCDMQKVEKFYIQMALDIFEQINCELTLRGRLKLSNIIYLEQRLSLHYNDSQKTKAYSVRITKNGININRT